MGKRRQKRDKSHAHRKRKRDKRRRSYDSDSYSSSLEEDYYKGEGYDNPQRRQSRPRYRSYTPELEYYEDLPLHYDSDDSLADDENRHLRSVVSDTRPRTGLDPATNEEAETHQKGDSPTTEMLPSSDTNKIPVPDDSAPSVSAETLPPEILEALGDPKSKEEVFGPKIPEEIAKRWGRVLVDGLTKEQKQDITEKCLVPDNFRLAKAPLLNPEIIPILSEPARHRDKLLEKSQNQLGLGISKLTNLVSTVIDGNLDKIEILKQISDASQFFLDLHHEDTKRRRRLVTSSLDKKFLNMISDVKRDTYLFGVNLGEKIKASKTAERSGLQIRRNDGAMTSKKYLQQGNWRGPPRAQAHRTSRPGGQKARYWPQANRRPPPPAPERRARAPPPARPNSNNNKTQ